MSDPKIEAVLNQSDLPPQAKADVRAAIDSSPYLQGILVKAVDEQRLKHFSLSKNEHEGGHYDAQNGTININPDLFKVKSPTERLDALTSVIGHEAGHALMARSAEFSTSRYAVEVQDMIRSASSSGDTRINITAPAHHTVEDFRKNEALAELISMNSMASRIAKGNGGKFDEDAFLRRADQHTSCIDNRKLDGDIHLNSKGFQSTGGKINSPAVEQIAICHFDRGDQTLGLKGTSSYHDHYAAYTLTSATDVMRDLDRGIRRAMPEVELDLAGLKSSRQGVEDAGVDLGGKGRTFDFIDLSGGQRKSVSIKQLGEGAKLQPDAEADRLRKPILADQAAHPDHGTYNRIHEFVSKTGQWNEQESKNVAASLYKEQIADPLLKRIDKIVGGVGQAGEHNVFAVYAPHGEKPPMFHAHVDGREAAHQPAQQNLQQAEQIKQQQVQQQQLEQQQQRDQVVQKGPTMSM